jgi:hypothetical protein
MGSGLHGVNSRYPVFGSYQLPKTNSFTSRLRHRQDRRIPVQRSEGFGDQLSAWTKAKPHKTSSSSTEYDVGQ